MLCRTDPSRENKTNLMSKWLTITLIVLLYDHSHARISKLGDGTKSALQRRSLNPKLKLALPATVLDRLPRTTEVYVEKKPEWDGEKPRLVGKPKLRTILPSTRNLSDRHTLQDTHQGGCKECYRKIKNLRDLCRFEFALRVKPVERQKHRFVVEILAVYRQGLHTNLTANTLVKLHLDAKDEGSLAINKDLSLCSCPYLRPNVSYVVFGRMSRQQLGIVTAVRAHRVHSNSTIIYRTDTMLRNLGSSCPPLTGPTQEVPNTSHSSIHLPKIVGAVNSTDTDLYGTGMIPIPTNEPQLPTSIDTAE